MSYRIIRITNLYVEYIRNYYEAFPPDRDKPFKEQLDHMIGDSVSGLYTKHLRDIGVDAFDIFTNAGPLQDRWKVENNCDKSGKELIFEQIKWLKPDVLWLDDPKLMDRAWFDHVRRNVPSVKLITGHFCAPYSAENIRNYRGLDFLLTCTPCLRNEFEDHGIETHLVYHGFEPGILDRVAVTNAFPESELVFTGSLYTGGGFHATRIAYIEELLKADLTMKIYAGLDPFAKVLSKLGAYYVINTIKAMGAEKLIHKVPLLSQYESYGDTRIKYYSRNLRASNRPAVYGLDQFRLLAKARICFNIHGEVAGNCAGNARLFEATGMGTCLVTDWKQNLHELFEPEKEVVTYNSKEECVEKIAWLLNHEAEASSIAKAGQSRTLRDHTIRKRAEKVNEIVRSKLFKN